MDIVQRRQCRSRRCNRSCRRCGAVRQVAVRRALSRCTTWRGGRQGQQAGRAAGVAESGAATFVLAVVGLAAGPIHVKVLYISKAVISQSPVWHLCHFCAPGASPLPDVDPSSSPHCVIPRTSLGRKSDEGRPTWFGQVLAQKNSCPEIQGLCVAAFRPLPFACRGRERGQILRSQDRKE